MSSGRNAASAAYRLGREPAGSVQPQPPVRRGRLPGEQHPVQNGLDRHLGDAGTVAVLGEPADQESRLFQLEAEAAAER